MYKYVYDCWILSAHVNERNCSSKLSDANGGDEVGDDFNYNHYDNNNIPLKQ